MDIKDPLTIVYGDPGMVIIHILCVEIGKTSYFALNTYLYRNMSSEWKIFISDWKNTISVLKNLIYVRNTPISGLKKPPLPKVIFIDGNELLNSQVVHSVLS